MLTIHAGTGADEEYTSRSLPASTLAVGDAALPDDEEFRRVLHDYMSWATSDVGVDIAPGIDGRRGLDVPHWSWTARNRRCSRRDERFVGSGLWLSVLRSSSAPR